MTITQLRYVIAIEKYQSFIEAARQCNISQSTLSMQVKKLEEDLNVILFDRGKKPVQLTDIGRKVIHQAKISLNELKRIKEVIENEKEAINEELRIGIIPTLAPFLLPLFVVEYAQKYNTKLVFHECISDDIIHQLNNNQLDVGILVTPLENESLTEFPIFYESFVGYFAPSHPLSQKQEITFNDLDINHMWLLKEGHCFRSQVLNICGKNVLERRHNKLQFESGSIETLYRIVEKEYGYTLLPELATLLFNESQKNWSSTFLPLLPREKLAW